MPIVLDASVTVDWFSSSVTAVGDAALEAVGQDGAIVPSMWRWEVQDVLRRLAKNGRLSTTVTGAITALRALPIEIDMDLAGLFGQEYEIASKHNLSVYDAAYLDVAIRRNIKLATGDKQLAAAARAIGLLFTV